MAVKYVKSKVIPKVIIPRKIICCLCSESGIWGGEVLEKFSAKYPDSKERYISKAEAKQLRLGDVVFCVGNNENTLVADMVCLRSLPDKFNNTIDFGFLYGCLLQVVLRACQKEAAVIVAAPGVPLREWQAIKFAPILEHAVEVIGEGVEAVFASPYDLLKPEKDDPNAVKPKARRTLKKNAASTNSDDDTHKSKKAKDDPIGKPEIDFFAMAERIKKEEEAREKAAEEAAYAPDPPCDNEPDVPEPTPEEIQAESDIQETNEEISD